MSNEILFDSSWILAFIVKIFIMVFMEKKEPIKRIKNKIVSDFDFKYLLGINRSASKAIIVIDRFKAYFLL